MVEREKGKEEVGRGEGGGARQLEERERREGGGMRK